MLNMPGKGDILVIYYRILKLFGSIRLPNAVQTSTSLQMESRFYHASSEP
jgi:hypothetical protein